MDEKTKIDSEGIAILKETINHKYGFDYSGYSEESFVRALKRFIEKNELESIANVKSRLIEDKNFFKFFVDEMTINTTEMFRDPEFYKSFREKLISHLDTFPFIRIWVAGCSSGEEAYSIAILLKEENILHKTIIYATDINEEALFTAKLGLFDESKTTLYNSNYKNSGGKLELSDYYTKQLNKNVINTDLKEHVVFSYHNLVSDSSFNEFHIIICRNVMIYFNEELKQKTMNLFNNSLVRMGHLILGTAESSPTTTNFLEYVDIDGKQNIFQKKK